MATNWTPESWRDATGIHMPAYKDAAALAATENTLRNYPPLVFAGEARNLTTDLANGGRADLRRQVTCGETWTHGGTICQATLDTDRNNRRR